MRPDTWPMFADPAIWGFLFEGLRETIYIALVSVALSFVVGLLFALGRLSRRRWIRWPSIFYIEGVRALPVLLLIVYFGIKGSALFRPIFGPDFDLPRFWAGVLGLSMYTSAVLAEIIRAGIVSLPRGQTEAARALGLSHAQTMRSVILPQALAADGAGDDGPAHDGDKGHARWSGRSACSSCCSQGRTIYTQFFNPIEVLLIVATIYFVICFALSQASRRLELGYTPARGEEEDPRHRAAGPGRLAHPRVDARAVREALHPNALHREGRDRVRESSAVVGRAAVRECDRETRGERVARAGRIDDALGRIARDRRLGPAVEHEHAALGERDVHAAVPRPAPRRAQIACDVVLADHDAGDERHDLLGVLPRARLDRAVGGPLAQIALRDEDVRSR